MPETSVAVPISMLIPIGGAIVAALGWLFNLQGRVKTMESDFATYKSSQAENSAQYRAAAGSEFATLNVARHDANNRLHLLTGRLDLCEERHRTFVAEQRRVEHRLSSDHQLSGQLARLQRSLQSGKVVDLSEALEED